MGRAVNQYYLFAYPRSRTVKLHLKSCRQLGDHLGRAARAGGEASTRLVGPIASLANAEILAGRNFPAFDLRRCEICRPGASSVPPVIDA